MEALGALNVALATAVMTARTYIEMVARIVWEAERQQRKSGARQARDEGSKGARLGCMLLRRLSLTAHGQWMRPMQTQSTIHREMQGVPMGPQSNRRRFSPLEQVSRAIPASRQARETMSEQPCQLWPNHPLPAWLQSPFVMAVLILWGAVHGWWAGRGSAHEIRPRIARLGTTNRWR